MNFLYRFRKLDDKLLLLCREELHETASPPLHA